MATKTAAKAKDDAPAEGTPDGPILDLTDAGVKKMIKSAKSRGYITYDELNAVLPSEQFTSEQIEDIMSKLSEMGINVTENDEEEEEGDNAAKPAAGTAVAQKADGTGSSVVTTNTSSSADRTDDPVRMYLREMGTVELLSREGEIAIAKRIEAGRETMIRSLCESSLTFEAITVWRDELNDCLLYTSDAADE